MNWKRWLSAVAAAMLVSGVVPVSAQEPVKDSGVTDEKQTYAQGSSFTALATYDENDKPAYGKGVEDVYYWITGTDPNALTRIAPGETITTPLGESVIFYIKAKDYTSGYTLKGASVNGNNSYYVDPIGVKQVDWLDRAADRSARALGSTYENHYTRSGYQQLDATFLHQLELIPFRVEYQSDGEQFGGQLPTDSGTYYVKYNDKGETAVSFTLQNSELNQNGKELVGWKDRNGNLHGLEDTIEVTPATIKNLVMPPEKENGEYRFVFTPVFVDSFDEGYTISKFTDGYTTPLSGARFSITRKEGNEQVGEEKDDLAADQGDSQNRTASFALQKNKQYKISEIATPEGFEPVEDFYIHVTPGKGLDFVANPGWPSNKPPFARIVGKDIQINNRAKSAKDVTLEKIYTGGAQQPDDDGKAKFFIKDDRDADSAYLQIAREQDTYLLPELEYGKLYAIKESVPSGSPFSGIAAPIKIKLDVNGQLLLHSALDGVSLSQNKITVINDSPYPMIYEDGVSDEEIAVPKAGAAKEGTQVTVSSQTPERDGWNFAGWSDGENVYQAAERFIMPARAVTLTAQWEQETPPSKSIMLSHAYYHNQEILENELSESNELEVTVDEQGYVDTRDWQRPALNAGGYTYWKTVVSRTMINSMKKTQQEDGFIDDVMEGERFFYQPEQYTYVVAIYYNRIETTPAPTPDPDPSPNPNPPANPGDNNGGAGSNWPGDTGPNDGGNVLIPDEEVPLSNLPDLVEIPDEQVPLGNLPQTGRKSVAVGAAGTILLLAGLLLHKRK